MEIHSMGIVTTSANLILMVVLMKISVFWNMPCRLIYTGPLGPWSSSEMQLTIREFSNSENEDTHLLQNIC